MWRLMLSAAAAPIRRVVLVTCNLVSRRHTYTLTVEGPLEGLAFAQQS